MKMSHSLTGICTFLLLFSQISFAQGIEIVEKILEHKVYTEDGKIVHYLKNFWKEELKNITIEDYLDNKLERKFEIPLLKSGEEKILSYRIAESGNLKSFVFYFLYGEKHKLIPKSLKIKIVENRTPWNFSRNLSCVIVASLIILLIFIILKRKKP